MDMDLDGILMDTGDVIMRKNVKRKGNYRRILRDLVRERGDLFSLESGFMRIDRMPMDVYFDDFIDTKMFNLSMDTNNRYRIFCSTWMGDVVYMMHWDMVLFLDDSALDVFKSRMFERGINMDDLFI